jgi:ribosome-associated protein
MKHLSKRKRSSDTADQLPAREKALLCAKVAADHKAENPLVLKVAEVASFSDYFVICSGRSTRHVQAIAEHIEETLHQHQVKSLGVEGLREGQWVLLDFGDVIVHIFYQPIRTFYDLEGLWADAHQVDPAGLPLDHEEQGDPTRPDTAR